MGLDALPHGQAATVAARRHGRGGWFLRAAARREAREKIEAQVDIHC
jgi:hypothetical protein